MGSTCCYKCENRILGCHSSCAKYLEFEANKNYMKTTRESKWKSLSQLGFSSYEVNHNGDIRNCYELTNIKRYIDNKGKEYYILYDNGINKRISLKTILDFIS